MRNRLSLSVAAAGVVLLASTASAQAISIKKAYPKALDSGGTPVSVAGSNGTAAWLTQEKNERTGGDYFLHILKPGGKQATKVAVKSDAFLSELAMEAAGKGKTTVVAVARESARSSASGDIVSIDPASGAVTKIEGASDPKVREFAPALADGTLFFASWPDTTTWIKQVPVTGGKATIFTKLFRGETRAVSLATFPGNTEKLGVFSDLRSSGENRRRAVQTMTANGKVRVFKAQRGWHSWIVQGPYVDDKGEMLYVAGTNKAWLYRAGTRKPLRESWFTLDAAWVGGDLGLVAAIPTIGNAPLKTTLRATGPLK